MLQLTERRAGIILYFTAISRQHALQKGSTIAVTGEDNMQFFGHDQNKYVSFYPTENGSLTNEEYINEDSLDEVIRYGTGKDAATAFVENGTREPREQFEFFLQKTRQYALQKGSTIAVTGKDNLQFFGLLLLSGYHTNENLFWSSAEDTPLY
ncbi:hypothetical protein T11_16988 [Trichinella zimbabwensis]|uniref:Uncharacterized protein n=1 Tax=Trichinella zimbabwensis TaxID=268475 RepID=A0A0V1IB61_9BILA|nr:hypothetical protein T11_16988 [Trichinella zimbabwensis]